MIRTDMVAVALLCLASPAQSGQEPDWAWPTFRPPGTEPVFVGHAAIETQDFMDAYAEEPRLGDRAAIARRYHRGGAWRVGNGEARLESWAEIEAFYAGREWSPPTSFEWRDLSFEVLSPDSVVVVGLFRWGLGEGGAPVTVSYTGLLVRQDGELRIRLEDESAARPQ